MTNGTNTRTLADLIKAGTVKAPPKQLTQDEKEQLAEAGTAFTITDIKYGDTGDFGPFFELHIDLNDEPAVFRLASNDNRNELLESLAQAVVDGPISGVCLRAIGTRGGNKFLTIDTVS